MWFLIISALIFSVYAIFMPKKLTRIEIFSTIFFAMTLQDNVDIYLDGKYDLYGYFTKGIQWKTLIAIIGIYPAITTIFLNYYPSQRQWQNKLVYILAWSGLLFFTSTLRSNQVIFIIMVGSIYTQPFHIQFCSVSLLL